MDSESNLQYHVILRSKINKVMVLLEVLSTDPHSEQEKPIGERLNRRYINPEANIARLVRSVRLDLLLDPLNADPAALSVVRVGVLNTRLPVTVAGEPGVKAVVALAFGVGSNFGAKIIGRVGN